jgi:hypothetical protein
MFYFIQDTEDMKLLVLENGVPFPPNDANSDYQAYLAWVAEGNTAEEWSA